MTLDPQDYQTVANLIKQEMGRSDLGALVRQLQGGIRGAVNGNGTVAAGQGFRVAHNGAGDYTVTFSRAFAATPVVQATAFYSGGPTAIRVYAKSATAFSVATFTSTTGALIDSNFDFRAEIPD